MTIVRLAVDAWCTAAHTAVRRPMPFLVAAASLTATDLLAWKLGALDGVKAVEANQQLLAAFVFGKLGVTLSWILGSLRLVNGVEEGLLRLGGRQVLWLGGLFLLVPLLLILRFVLQSTIGAALTPLDIDPRLVLLLSVGVYVALVLHIQVRLIPGLVGVLLGDEEAGLRWSWRGTKRLALPFIGALCLAVLPLFVLHFSNNLVWLPASPVGRLAVLTLDGVTMAFLLLTSCAAYVDLYRRTKGGAYGQTVRRFDSLDTQQA